MDAKDNGQEVSMKIDFQKWIVIGQPQKFEAQSPTTSTTKKNTVVRCTEEAMHAWQKVRGECDKETNIKVGSI